MSRGISSLKYLKDLSTMILAFERNVIIPVINGKPLPDLAINEDWREIVLLAEEIHDLVVPKKEKKDGSAGTLSGEGNGASEESGPTDS
jgi:hypothetical protein